MEGSQVVEGYLVIPMHLSWIIEHVSAYIYSLARTQSGPNLHLNVQETFKHEACTSNE